MRFPWPRAICRFFLYTIIPKMQTGSSFGPWRGLKKSFEPLFESDGGMVIPAGMIPSGAPKPWLQQDRKRLIGFRGHFLAQGLAQAVIDSTLISL